MTTIEILLIAWAAGVVLERRGDQIVVRGIKPDTPPELLNLLRQRKADLLAVLTDNATNATNATNARSA